MRRRRKSRDTVGVKEEQSLEILSPKKFRKEAARSAGE
jgi:hypothetical protein